MIEHPTKVFPCDCMGEGVAVSKLNDNTDISEGEVMMQDYELKDYKESPFIQLAFWEHGHCIKGRWSWWWRLKIAWYVFRKGTPWSDMVIMRAKVAKNLAYHIIYLIDKDKNKPTQEPIVKEEL